MDNLKVFYNKFSRYIWIFVVVMLLEVLVFNIRSFSLIGGGYEEQTFYASEAVVNAGEIKANTVVSGSDACINVEFTDIDTRVKTIYLNMDFNDKVVDKDIQINFKDATYSENYRAYWTGTETSVINGYERSMYIPLSVSGNVEALRIRVKADDNERIQLNSIIVNKSVPFKFSILRVLVMYIIIAGTYALHTSKKLKLNYEKSIKTCRIIFAVITCAVIIFIYFVSNMTLTGKKMTFREALGGVDSGNQVTQELVDAFEAGQVSLLNNPSDTLMRLENPYDYSLRDKEGVLYDGWDHCFYNGKFYSYYGIGPVITLFLPFHKMFGAYFSSNIAVFLYSVMGIIFLALFYDALMKRHFSKLRADFAVMGFIMLIISSGIYFAAARPLFYEIAAASSFMAVAMGAYFLISSDIMSGKKINYIRLALATSSLGFAVLCRPTTAVYCVASLVFIAYGLVNLIKTKSDKIEIVKLGLASGLPYVIFGGIQMWYNNARFDSPLDFGINYSVTINDFTSSDFHAQLAAISFYAFLFAAPKIVPAFPYIASEFHKLNLIGFYFVDDAAYTGLAIGAVFRALPIFAYLLGFKALKRQNKGFKWAPALCIGLGCIIAPLAIIFSTWESGFAVRYYSDFSWQLLIGALIIIFVLIKACKNEGIVDLAGKAFIVMTLLCILVNAGQIYNFIYAASNLRSLYSDICQSEILAFARLWDFWY